MIGTLRQRLILSRCPAALDYYPRPAYRPDLVWRLLTAAAWTWSARPARVVISLFNYL